MSRTVFEFFLSGILFGAGPCLVSCGPVLLAYLTGTKQNSLKGLLLYSIFSSARVLAYIFLSLTVYFLGNLAAESILGEFSPYLFFAGGLFISAVGIFLTIGSPVGYKMDSKLGQLLQKYIFGLGITNVFILGLIMGFLPCPPFLALLSYIGLVSRSWVNSIWYTLVFGLGTFISPLLLLTFLSGLLPGFFKNKKSAYYRFVGAFCGIIILVYGARLMLRAF